MSRSETTYVIWLICLTLEMAHGAAEEGLGKYGGVRKRDANTAYSAECAERTINEISTVCTTRTPLKTRE